MKFKFITLGIATLLSSFSANANTDHQTLYNAKTLLDLKVLEVAGSQEGIVCARKGQNGKFTFIPGKVHKPELKGQLDRYQQALFEKLEAVKEGEKLEYSHANMKKVAMVKKFGPDVVCAHVKPEGEIMNHYAKPAEAKSTLIREIKHPHLDKK